MLSNFDKVFDKLTKNYEINFSEKNYNEENDNDDIIMNLFAITPELKRENRQYWGRELGMYWQKLVCEIFKNFAPNLYAPPVKYGADEPFDLIVGNYAIDTKYRVGSGDAGTLKKFKQYGEKLKSEGYQPIFLIVRDDNLSTAITAIEKGGWKIYTGQDSFDFISQHSNFDLKQYLQTLKTDYSIHRKN